MPYSDYPQAATNNAKRALKIREEEGTDCGTRVGWESARIIANREEISKQRLPRIYSFLSRAKVYDQGNFKDEDGKQICGSIMYAAWGGDEMHRWAERTLEKEQERSISDLSATARKGLENKVEEHNEEYGEDKTKRVTLGMLAEVYKRGVGAYHTNPESVRPSVSSPEQWAMARVNSFIYAVINERFRSGKHDTDLFPEGHPLKSEEKMKEEEKKELRLTMVINEDIAIIDDRLAYSTQEKAEEMAENIGIEGFHTHELEGNTWYMPGEMHVARYHHEEEEDKRAEPDELSVGDFVSWNSAGGRSQGLIVEVSTDGQVEADTGFKVNGTEQDPAALISIYDYDNEEGAFMERRPPLKVAHLFSILSKIEGAEVRSKKDIVEKRSYNSETRAVEGRTVEGYASVFNTMSEDLGGFREVILPGAFKNALGDDIRALYNHDSNYLLARTTSGTLEVREDDKGLYYTFEMPNTSYGNDLLELYRRGDLTQSSFGFTVDKDSWRMQDGQQVRYIESVSSLFDVSAVVFPAYASASSGLRSAEPNGEGEAQEAREKTEKEVNYTIYENLIKLALNDEC